MMTVNNKSGRNDEGKCLGWPITSFSPDIVIKTGKFGISYCMNLRYLINTLAFGHYVINFLGNEVTAPLSLKMPARLCTSKCQYITCFK